MLAVPHNMEEWELGSHTRQSSVSSVHLRTVPGTDALVAVPTRSAEDTGSPDLEREGTGCLSLCAPLSSSLLLLCPQSRTTGRVEAGVAHAAVECVECASSYDSGHRSSGGGPHAIGRGYRVPRRGAGRCMLVFLCVCRSLCLSHTFLSHFCGVGARVTHAAVECAECATSNVLPSLCVLFSLFSSRDTYIVSSQRDAGLKRVRCVPLVPPVFIVVLSAPSLSLFCRRPNEDQAPLSDLRITHLWCFFSW